MSKFYFDFFLRSLVLLNIIDLLLDRVDTTLNHILGYIFDIYLRLNFEWTEFEKLV